MLQKWSGYSLTGQTGSASNAVWENSYQRIGSHKTKMWSVASLLERRFTVYFYKLMSLLTYYYCDEAKDLLFVMFVLLLETKTGNSDMAFIECSFLDWKDASGEKGTLSSHKQSSYHKRTGELMVTLLRTTNNVRELLLFTYSQKNRLIISIP